MKVTFMIADQTGYSKCTAFGDKFKTSIIDGSSIVLQNYLFEDGHIKIVRQTNVLRYSHMEIPDDIRKAAANAFTLPVSPIKSICDVKASPLKRKVSFVGHVVSPQSAKKIKTKKGHDVFVKNMTVQDDSGEISVSLWQEAAHFQTQEGQKVMIKDAQLSHNNFQNQNTVSVNDSDDIQVMDEEEKEQREILLAAVQEMGDDLMILNDEDHLLYNASKQALLCAVGVQTVEKIVPKLPLKMLCTLVYRKIVDFKKIDVKEAAAKQKTSTQKQRPAAAQKKEKRE